MCLNTQCRPEGRRYKSVSRTGCHTDSLAHEATFFVSRRIVHGPVPAACIPDRRERAELFPRGSEALSHAARGEHRHPKARGIGGPAAPRAWRAPGEANRRARIAPRLRGTSAESARQNSKGNGRPQKHERRRADTWSERKLDSRIAPDPGPLQEAV